MWFGTLAGLNRYDGYKFKVFKHNLRDTVSLNDDYITNVFEGPGQKLLVQTRLALNIYDPVTEKFNRNPTAYFKSIGVNETNVKSVIHDNLGSFWIIGAQNGLYKYAVKSKNAFRYQSKKGSTHLIDESPISSIALNATGNLYVVHVNGIIELVDNKTNKVLNRIHAISRENIGSGIADYRIFIDKENELYLYNLSQSKGLLNINTSSNKVRYIHKDDPHLRLNSNVINSVLQDNNGKIWIGTDHGGINILDKNKSIITYLLSGDDDKGLSQNSIYSMYKDNSGIIWVGTYKEGISYYHENLIQFPLYARQPSNSNSLPYNDINRFAEDAKGNLWIGTNGGGLIYYNRQTEQFKRYTHSSKTPNSLCNDVVVTLFIDHEQKLWIGTYLGGLDSFDGKTFTHYRHNDANQNTIADDRVWEIMEDSRKNLWVGTLAGGLDLFDRQRNVFYHHRQGEANSVHSNDIISIVEDSKGNLWVGTSYGIDVLELATKKFTHYLHADNLPSISNNNVNNILLDSRGLMWVGTRDGLDVFNAKRQVIASLRTEDGLPDNTILGIQEDNKHGIWVSTPNGISHIFITGSVPDKLRFQFMNYDEQDGLQGRAFNDRAAFKTKKGELIFAGANGFNMFQPEKIKTITEFSKIVLTDLQIFNKSVAIGDEVEGHVILEKSINETRELVLNYNENVFSFEFASLNFSNPDKVKYSYMLEGFDKEWLAADNKIRKATFTNIDPGDYTFKVKYAIGNGDLTSKVFTLKVKVLPPFWKTPLAYILYALLAFTILMQIRKRGITKLKNEFLIEQERQEAQRMHELDMMKIKFFTNVSHEFRTPLSLIITPLEKILSQGENQEQKSQLQLIYRNARRLLNMVNQLLDFRKLEDLELKLFPSHGDIVKLIRELSFSFTDLAEKKNIRFSFKSNVEFLETVFDNDKIERILFNLLSNAFKFTPENGRVNVELNLIKSVSERDKKQLEIKIQDTGIGIEPAKHHLIFDRFFQNEVPGFIINQGSGIGLSITKEFVHLHGGTIDVESEPGKGSCFIVKLPVKASRMKPAVPELRNNISEEKLDVNNIEFNDATIERRTLRLPAILLVEDNDDFRGYLKENLSQHFEITEAVNGKEGWQKTLATHPNLIISDISMPEMDGIDLCKKIRADKRTKHLPVILLTALMGEEHQLKGLETGASDYLSKPFNLDILLSKVRNLLLQQETLKKTYQKHIDIKSTVADIDSPDKKFVVQVLQVIEKNLSNADFSVEELSSEVNMSRVALYKKILKLTGKTPFEFIKSIRLNRAVQMLEKKEFTVAEISYQVGFNNPKYFTKLFKSEFGVLPSSYVNGIKK
ncbi:MAG: response regulator [Sphingobacteriales bacterium]|nr:response regulator [Sphingobacteriales bacterium]